MLPSELSRGRGTRRASAALRKPCPRTERAGLSAGPATPPPLPPVNFPSGDVTPAGSCHSKAECARREELLRGPRFHPRSRQRCGRPELSRLGCCDPARACCGLARYGLLLLLLLLLF